jgi:hypothetical protein
VHAEDEVAQGLHFHHQPPSAAIRA